MLNTFLLVKRWATIWFFPQPLIIFAEKNASTFAFSSNKGAGRKFACTRKSGDTIRVFTPLPVCHGVAKTTRCPGERSEQETTARYRGIGMQAASKHSAVTSRTLHRFQCHKNTIQ